MSPSGIDTLQRQDWGAEGSDGRVMSGWSMKTGYTCLGLLEFTTATIDAAMLARIEKVKSRLSKHHLDEGRPDEAQTFLMNGFVRIGDRMALVYKCPSLPVTLQDVIQRLEKPSREDRTRLALSIANSVRSLLTEFDIQHPDLRTQSFGFIPRRGDPGAPNMTRPWLLDWARQPEPSIYQHPRYRPDKPMWTHAAFSLLMVLSEIAEWKVLDSSFENERKLKEMKAARVKQLKAVEWEGFKIALQVLEIDPARLETWDKFVVKKRFYDVLCAELENKLKQ